MRMDLAELPALMFRNPAHGGLNMVYRRPDGHVAGSTRAAREKPAPDRRRWHEKSLFMVEILTPEHRPRPARHLEEASSA